MNYLTLDLANGNLLLNDNSVWKSLRTWLNGGTLYSDYYDASDRGDYWKASEHWININSSSTYLAFNIEYAFVNASATDSCLCQIKYDETNYGIAVTADLAGLNIQSATSVKHIDCDYFNANIKIDVVVNLLTKEITTYIHKNGIPLIKVVNDSSSYTFTKFVIQAGALGDSYKLLPTTTKLLNVSVSDDNITYSNFTDAINYVDKFGVAEIWTNTKNYIASQLLGKSDVGHTHSASDITSGLATVATSGSYNDLTNKPTIPTVNNATLTIQKNGTTVKTFTANASSNVTCNITVPTKTSELTNNSGFLTSHQDLSGYVPKSGGAVFTGQAFSRNVNDSSLTFRGGTNAWGNGGELELQGKDKGGSCALRPTNGSDYSSFSMSPDGTVKATHGAGLNVVYATQYNWVEVSFCGGDSIDNGSSLQLHGKNFPLDNYLYAGAFRLRANNGTNSKDLMGAPNGTLTWGSKNIAMQEDVVPRSGGAVITGNLYKTVTNDSFILSGGTNWDTGGAVILYGANSSTNTGCVLIQPAISSTVLKYMLIRSDGTWTWNGTACQITSDQRLKQQIAEIDDKLLDAWQDVDLVQFKYNDAVDEKGKDKARLHTGFVVQQIDSACKSHGVDISEYGLYCHEEYPEETEEVEVEQADGTKTKERKVIREASEHYSLRYTEALIIECAYLRKCIKELRAEIEQLKSSK